MAECREAATFSERELDKTKPCTYIDERPASIPRGSYSSRVMMTVSPPSAGVDL